MRYMISVMAGPAQSRSVLVEADSGDLTSFPAEVGNPNYDSFIESQSLTDAEVQAMEPDVWHDMA